MKRPLAFLGVAALCFSGLLVTATTAGASSRPSDDAIPQVAPTPQYRPVCPATAIVQCRAFVRTDVHGLAADGLPNGLGPADLVSAYNLPKGGKGVTVAITGLGGYSKAESDLAAYRSTYGLPKCTIASGCLTLVNEAGQTSPLPADYPSWWGESALDMDMVSASCPKCKILYVEANTSEGVPGLLISINTAVKLGATIVTNSWGAYGDGAWLDKDYAKYFNHPHDVILFASGDIGYGDAEPNSKFLVMVGSTTLTKTAKGRGWSETVWNGSTSWCTKENKRASWMPGSGCSGRLMVDVSTVGDPATGVAVNVDGQWHVEGGTSVSSPFVAGIYALGGKVSAAHASKSLYQTLGSNPKAFYDVTVGSNGTCTPKIFCTAGVGYDGASGVGTPNGIAGFK